MASEPNVGLFREMWPLHAVRYGLITAGVLAWLWDAAATTGFLLSALFFALALVLELPLYSERSERDRVVLGLVQVALALAALAGSPGLAAGLFVSAILCGFAAQAAWLYAGIGLAVAGITTAGVLWVVHGFSGTFTLLSAYTLAVWAGRTYGLRLHDLRRYKETVAELKEAQERIARFAETGRELAAARERQRLAEELHDTLGHALVATLLQVQIARRLIEKEPAAADERLALVEHSVRETLDQVRAALRRGKQNRTRLPLHMALESLVADFQAAGGPEVTLRFDPDPESVSDVSAEAAEVVYRTTQEALTNAVRHGKARNVVIDAEAVGPRLFLRIRDDGVGAHSYTPGMGLSGMVKRVQAVGGTLRFQTAPGEGFQVEVGVKRR